jgi:hypothetical protein
MVGLLQSVNSTPSLEICGPALTACMSFVILRRRSGPPSSQFLMCYGPEFVARNVRAWLGRIGVTTLYR